VLLALGALAPRDRPATVATATPTATTATVATTTTTITATPAVVVPSAAPASASTVYSIQFEATGEGDSLSVTGTTNLPDGSVISIGAA
jgi:hypothetical protein